MVYSELHNGYVNPDFSDFDQTTRFCLIWLNENEQGHCSLTFVVNASASDGVKLWSLID